MCSIDRCGGGLVFVWLGIFFLMMIQPDVLSLSLPFIKLLSVAKCDSKYQSGGISNVLICLFYIPKC